MNTLFPIKPKVIKQITMILHITPTAQRRVRFRNYGKFVGTHKAPEQIAAEDFIMNYIKPYVPDTPMTGGIELIMKAVFPVPTSKPQWWATAAINGTIPHIKKPDKDNLEKNICDCMETMGFYKNDSQIFKSTIRKCYGEKGLWAIRLIEYQVPQSKKEYLAYMAKHNAQ